MSKDNFLIYGANGYTGKLIASLAVEKGLKPVLAGRNSAEIRELATELGLESIVFGLEDEDKIVEGIEPFIAVLHCAGPFSITSQPMIRACLKAETHYLDITGEIDVFEFAASKNDEAKSAGIVLMPGVGFDVVPSDCLAAHLASRLPEADHLELAFKGAGGISKGTAITMMENFHKGGVIRENGELKKVPTAYESRKIFFGPKELMATTIPWGDVSTAYYSTGIPNIKVFTAVKPKVIKFMELSNSIGWLLKMEPVKKFIERRIRKSISGPSKEVRESGRSILWGKAYHNNISVEATLTTCEGYQLTAMTAVGSVEKLLNQRIFAGFKTPSMAFGSDFILEFEHTQREDK